MNSNRSFAIDDPQAKAEKPTNYVAQALEELLAGKADKLPTRRAGSSA